jgi:hypothetical protein
MQNIICIKNGEKTREINYSFKNELITLTTNTKGGLVVYVYTLI